MSAADRNDHVPTLEQVAERCEHARDFTARRDQAKSARNLAVRNARTQGARKKALEEAAGLSQRSVAYLTQDVKPAPELGVSPDLQQVVDAARALEEAEEHLARALDERDLLIRRARKAKRYTLEELQKATGLARATLYKV